MFYKISFIVCIHGLRVFSLMLPIFLRKRPKKNSILYLAAFYPNNAGYHYRVRSWANILTQENYNVCVKASSYEDKGKNIHKYFIIVMIKRFFQVLLARKYQLIIVRRELLPGNDYGNFFLEKLLIKLCDYRILDFDDDIMASKREGLPREKSTFSYLALQTDKKFSNSLNYYNAYIGATNYLIKKFSLTDKKHVVIPTCVNYHEYKQKDYPTNKSKETNLGWIGSDNNQEYLREVMPLVEKVAEKHDLMLTVISSKKFDYKSKKITIDNVKWTLSNQVDALTKIDVGLMPLPNNLVTKGKAGFKLIQYMGLGIVSIASAITVNNEIVNDKEDGFLITDSYSLQSALEDILALNPDRLNVIGKLASEKVKNNFSFISNKKKYLNFVNSFTLT